MSRPAFALAPGALERALRAGVLGYVALLVALPLAALVHAGLAGGLSALSEAVTAPVARSALALTLWTATLVALLDAVLGTATAWVLVRYRFPGRAVLSALVDLPFAVPTLVAGMMLAGLYGRGALIGNALHAVGIHYTTLYYDDASGLMPSAAAPGTDAGAAHGNSYRLLKDE